MLETEAGTAVDDLSRSRILERRLGPLLARLADAALVADHPYLKWRSCLHLMPTRPITMNAPRRSPAKSALLPGSSSPPVAALEACRVRTYGFWQDDL